MIKRKIKYVDYDGNQREEVFMFNLSKAELIEMEYSQDGGMEQYIEKIVAEQDRMKIMDLFKKMILASYGEKSADGKRFIKSPELSLAFCQTEAYSVLLMGFLENPDDAAAFIEGLMPADMVAETKNK